MKTSPYISKVSFIYEGDAEGLCLIAVLHTHLELNANHPDYDNNMVDQLIEDSMAYIRGDFAVASQVRIITV